MTSSAFAQDDSFTFIQGLLGQRGDREIAVSGAAQYRRDARLYPDEAPYAV